MAQPAAELSSNIEAGLSGTELIAALSGAALSPLPIERFADEATQLVCRLVGGDGAAMCELIDDDRFVFTGTYGWQPPVGSDMFTAYPDSQAKFVLASNEVVVVADQLGPDDRFVPSGLLAGAGFVTAASVRIGTADSPLGLIGVYFREHHELSADELSNLRAAAGVLAVGVARRRGRRDLDYQASHDTLTGLVNRAGLFETMSSMIEGNARPPAVVLLDLDGFKPINDRYGHAAGDAVLRVIAERLSETVRGSDLVARLSGDEFVLVCPGLDRGMATQFTERLVGRIEQGIDIEGRHVTVSASIGVALTETAITVDELLEAAEGAMKQAKDEGRGRVVILDPKPTPLPVLVAGPDRRTSRPLLVSGNTLTSAISGVHAVFQPIVRASDHSVVGLEALARGPVGSDLAMPDSLFGVAAAHGRTAEVELAAKRAAFAAALPDHIPLFVNLDPAVLVQDGWLDRLVEYWEQLGRRRQVVVELTERALTASPRRLMAAVDRCRRLGWLIALDDIGARAESLTVLRIVRPDVVKLDMSLTADPTTAHASAVATAIASHRERGAVHVIAEGVESLEHELAARILGASYLQGYWFGRPQHAADLDLDSAAQDPGEASNSPLATAPAVPRRTLERSVATKSQLLGLSRYIEGISWSPDAMVLAALQDVKHYTPRTRKLYTTMARQCGLVGVVGQGLTPGVFDGVKQAGLRPGDEMRRNWQVVSLSVAGGVALLATEVGPSRLADGDRMFRYRITSVAEEVEEAAVRLLRYF